MMRLIYYSMVPTPDGKYERQWIQSVRSLRAHNPSIRVSLFAFGEISSEALTEAARQNVSMLNLGDYDAWMAQRPHACSSVLSTYRTFHNLLVLGEMDTHDVSQALFVDCDTFFFQDPAILFEQCSQCDWYAREIPGSRLSPHSPTSNLDEALVTEIARYEALKPSLPFNTGVCLFNRKAWATLARFEETFFDYAWRLAVGLHRPDSVRLGGKAWPGARPRDETVTALQRLRALVQSSAGPADFERSLPYPSDNWWILNEIAWLLTAGRIDGLSQGVFAIDQVAQGHEFEMRSPATGLPATLVHYFSHYETAFFQRFPARPA